ncbi:MAG TPA: DnaJ domain-containing protein [Stellaceae bacterium]|nr:DnaJ domain-containing protein [Stellaceae bacterium]
MAILGGLAILGGVVLLIYLFLNTPPQKLAQWFKWVLIAAAAALALFLLLSERFSFLWLPLAIGLPAWRRYRSLFSGLRGPATSRSSDVQTPFLRMSLDHDTGTMTGTVLQGAFAGVRLEELRRADLIALLRECRAGDEEGARLVEAYLDRAHPDWRDDLGAGSERRAAPSGPDVSVDEAYAILGLEPGADAAAIREAHHRLMKQVHPDHGGSDYLAGKINRARDVLLQR